MLSKEDPMDCTEMYSAPLTLRPFLRCVRAEFILTHLRMFVLEYMRGRVCNWVCMCSCTAPILCLSYEKVSSLLVRERTYVCLFVCMFVFVFLFCVYV